MTKRKNEVIIVMGIKLPKQDLINVLWDESDDGELVEDKIIDTSRWSEIHEIIFSYKGKHYIAGYSCGATEYQDEGPWEYEDEVDCYEVQKVEKMVEVWERV